MVKEQILCLEKNELIGLINEMTVENSRIILDNIQIHINLLMCLNEVEYETSIAESITLSKLEPEIETLPKPIESSIVQEVKVSKPSYQEGWKNDMKSYIGIFNRNLRGGLAGDIYIPESIVRNLELEYLDWVKVTIKKIVNNKKMYDFELLEKHESYDKKSLNTINNRKTIEHGIVKYEETADKYYINVNTSDSLLKVVLTEADVSKFRIQPGDIVDYAYWADDNIMNGKIIWKHSFKDTESLEQAKPPPSSSPTHKKSKSNAVKRAVKPIYKDYKIGMVGGENLNLHKGIREEVERRKGIFIFLSGDEAKGTMESKLKKADFVIVYTQSISHDSMFFTKAVCKKNSIPVSYTKNIGSTEFIRRVNFMIKKNKEKDKVENRNLVNAF